MKRMYFVGSRLFLLILSLMACAQVSQAQLTTLHFFSASSYSSTPPWANADGAELRSGVIQAKDGNLYGTAWLGGVNGNGTVFKITTGGEFATLYSFSALSNGGYGTNSDGAQPSNGLIQGKDGFLYGSTRIGGVNGNGTIVRITTGGTLATLYSFSALSSHGTNSDGAQPWPALIQARDGNLYGTTEGGGANGGGTVFQITTGGKLTTLHYFSASSETSTPPYANTDGAYLYAGLIQGKDGFLYGTTVWGGVNGNGTVFKITTGGKFATLYAFNTSSPPYSNSNSDGADPYAGLTQASDGSLYGATSFGGVNGNGTLFRITTGGTLTTLYSFSATSGFSRSNPDGAEPFAALIQGKDGNLYGATTEGGANGTGTIFQLTPGGKLTTLSSFSAYSSSETNSNSDGAEPAAALTHASDGNLYGTTYLGGVSGSGTVFKLTMTPIITSISPTTGPVGTSVTVTGVNFTEAIAVNFGSIPVPFTINSDTSVTFSVPSPGAASPKITVVNPFGKATSSQSFVMAPKITGFSPARGPVGTSVTLTGVNFTQATSAKVGALPASFTVNSDTSLTLIVPVGAKSAKISVTDPFGKATSVTEFTVTL